MSTAVQPARPGTAGTRIRTIPLPDRTFRRGHGMLATLQRVVSLSVEIAETTELYAWGLDRELLALRGAMCACLRGAASDPRPERAEAP